MPININSIVWNNNIFYPKKSKDNYLPQANRFKRVESKEILFLYDEKQNINNEKSINTMTINYNINGLLDNRKVVFEKILWPNNFQSSNNMGSFIKSLAEIRDLRKCFYSLYYSRRSDTEWRNGLWKFFTSKFKLQPSRRIIIFHYL